LRRFQQTTPGDSRNDTTHQVWNIVWQTGHAFGKTILGGTQTKGMAQAKADNATHSSIQHML
jgi:hypothetical protein